MNRIQFIVCLAVMGMMSLAGSFLAAYVLQSGNAVSAQDEKPKAEKVGPVKATEFMLVDKKGKVRAGIDIGDDGDARFTLADADGNPRMQLSVGKRTSLMLFDKKQNPRYLLGQDDTSVIRSVLDAGGVNRMTEQFKDDGESQVSFNGPDKLVYFSVIAGPKSPSTLLLTDPSGKNQAVMFAKDDQTSLQLKAGEGSILSAVLGDGRPVLGLSKGGHLRMRGMLGAKGDPEFIFLNEKKEAIWRAGAKAEKKEDK